MSSIQEQKNEIRRLMRERRGSLASPWVRMFSSRIQQAIIELAVFQNAETVACYLSLPHEVQTRQIIGACWLGGQRVCAPAFDTIRGMYGWAWLEPFDDIRPGPRGVPEPADVRWASASQIDLVIVPAVALDRHGHRLGHGGGHFDRLLADTRGVRLGLVFEFQVLETVPTEEFDVAVDLLVTENCVHAISGMSVTEKSKQKRTTET